MDKAERPTGVAAPTRGRTRAVEDKARARPRPAPPPQLWPVRLRRRGEDRRRRGAIPRRRARTPRAAHPPQAPEGELEPDREEQEDDPELGKRADRLGVGDGDVAEPRMLGDERAEAGRAGEHADEDEADHRAHPKPREGGMTIPAAPRMTSASESGVLWNPAAILPLCRNRRGKSAYGTIRDIPRRTRGRYRHCRRVGRRGWWPACSSPAPACRTIVLEKHGDFLRDFRGDTVHPSTLRIFHELGLLDRLLARPHDKVPGRSSGACRRACDRGRRFSHFDPRWAFIAMMPQWEFLDFVARGSAGLYPAFELEMGAEATGLVRGRWRVSGRRGHGDAKSRARLVHRRRRPPLGPARGSLYRSRRSRRADGRLLVPGAQGADAGERSTGVFAARPDHGADRPRRLLAMRLCLPKGSGRGHGAPRGSRRSARDRRRSRAARGSTRSAR
jgi:hypothetical protein